jgi:hypothetical protein
LSQATVQYESSTYGIGTTDPFFGSPNQAGLNTLTSTSNGNTGIGWMIQRAEAAGGGATTTLLQLIDFNDGGDSLAADGDWQIIQTIDLSATASAWHHLAIDFNPATGAVVATHNDDTYNFNTSTDLLGTFYVGYRENLPGTGNASARPPTYDLFVDTGLDGDYNGDGKVDAADYVGARKTGTQADIDAFFENFGEGGPGGGGAVPEPGSMFLIAIGLAGFAMRGRNRI